MQTELEKNDYRFTCLFETVVLSPQFRNQRGKDYTPALQNRSTRRETVSQPNQISRRMMLQGLGCTIALPWLESAKLLRRRCRRGEPPKPPQRFACLFQGDGISPHHWWSKGDGAAMELGSSLESLAPYKEKLNVINGLFNRHGDGGHARCTGNILSGANLVRGRVIHGGVSMDQKLSQHFEEATRGAQHGARLRAAGQRLPREPVFDGLRLAHFVAHAGFADPDRAVSGPRLRQPLRRPDEQAARKHPR